MEIEPNLQWIFVKQPTTTTNKKTKQFKIWSVN